MEAIKVLEHVIAWVIIKTIFKCSLNFIFHQINSYAFKISITIQILIKFYNISYSVQQFLITEINVLCTSRYYFSFYEIFNVVLAISCRYATTCMTRTGFSRKKKTLRHWPLFLIIIYHFLLIIYNQEIK